jgi:hypothetical protein
MAYFIQRTQLMNFIRKALFNLNRAIRVKNGSEKSLAQKFSQKFL